MYTASYVDSQIKALKGQGISKADIIRHLTGYCQGWPYVFGAAGDMCTPANRKKYASYRQDHAAAIRGACPVLSGKQPACDGCKWVDTRIYDCRGFTRWLLSQVGVPLFGGTVTAQWEDNKNWVLKGDIQDMPRGLVCCVFRPSHTGMYTGDGWARHCGGKKGQVVEESLPGSPRWERWAIPAGLYTGAELEAAGVTFDSSKNIPTLRKGNSGDEVAELQMLLNAKYDYNLEIDGVFGAKTEAAVKSFQQGKGLTADGVVGPKTRAALGLTLAAETNAGADTIRPIPAAMSDSAGGTVSQLPTSVIPSGVERERNGVEGSESSAVSQAGMITLPLSDWQSIRAAMLAAYSVLQKYE